MMSNDDRFMLYGSPVSLILLNRKKGELYRGRGYRRIPLTEGQIIVKPSRSGRSFLITNVRDLPFAKAESSWEVICYVALFLERDEHVLVSVELTPRPIDLGKKDSVEFRAGDITIRV